MTDTTYQAWFEKLWARREEEIYPGFLGPLENRIYTLTPAHFTSLGVENCDPRYLTHGVLVSPPNEDRNAWVYITSGLSNPWGQPISDANPQGFSGVGLELLMFSLAPNPELIGILQWLMSVQILVAGGELQGELLEYFDRIALGYTLEQARGGKLSGLITLETPPDMPRFFELPSGRVDLLVCLGISKREMDFAATQGGPALLTLLKHHEVYPLTDPLRGEVL